MSSNTPRTLYSYFIKEEQEYKSIAVFLKYSTKSSKKIKHQHYTVKSSKKKSNIKASQFLLESSIKSLKKISINKIQHYIVKLSVPVVCN